MSGPFMLPKPLPRSLAKVLYVEDQPAVAAIVLLELVRARIDVATVRNGEECLALLRKQQFDLILLDQSLPDMDGLTICRHLKNDADLKRIPVIFFTAFSDEGHEREARRLGAVDYLRKRFHTTELAARILAEVELARRQPPPV